MGQARVSNRFYGLWLGLLGAAIALGLYAAVRIFAEGHTLFNANDVIVWSLPLGAYIFLALTSSGLTLLASASLVFGIGRFDPMAKRLVFLAIATLAGAFVAIGLELGSVFHMVYVVVSPNFASPIWWMGLIYGVELVVLVFKFYRMHRGDRPVRPGGPLAVVSFLCALIAPLMIGAVFGLTESRVTYFGPVMSVYCLAMALLSGVALFLLYATLQDRLGAGGTAGCVLEPAARSHDDIASVFQWTLGIVIVFTLVKFAIEATTTVPEFLNYHRFEHAFGAWHVFHTEVVLGLFVPFAMLAIPAISSSSIARMVAAAMVLAGALAMHMEILLAGQSRPIGPKAEQFPEFIVYVPSVWEWLVFLLALAVVLLLFTLGERYLNLGPESGECSE